MFCKGLPPSIDKDATILILGSMPGVASLHAQQYYAHPMNRFWKVMAAILDETLPESYEKKKAMLLRHHIALWDSIVECEREGSMDSAIRKEVGADIEKLLVHYPKIQRICCNGGKSFAALKKHNKALLKRENLAIHALPSTSPANARWRLPLLIDTWKAALT